MANDTDTDVLSGDDQGALAGGSNGQPSQPPPESPAGDVLQPPSMQDVSGATPMASPLGGQQPGQLPAMIAQGAAAGGTPVGAMVHHRHGGLLTGLAGVLLDGLAAGIMTPQSGQGFSQAAARAYQMPLERQQNQMAMQEFKTQQQLDQAKIAQAHVTYLQSLALANRLSDEQRAGVTDDFMKNIDSIKTAAPDAIDQLSTTPSADTAVQMINQMRIQDPSKGAQYWRFPTEHDGEGNVTEWGVYKLDLDKPIGRDVTMRLPGVDAQGNYEMRPLRIPGSTTIRDYMTLHGEDGMKGLMQIAVAGVKAQEKTEPKEPTAAGLEERAFQERKQSDTVQGKTPPSREQFHQEYTAKEGGGSFQERAFEEAKAKEPNLTREQFQRRWPQTQIAFAGLDLRKTAEARQEAAAQYQATDPRTGKGVAGSMAELQAAGFPISRITKQTAIQQQQTDAARDMIAPDGLFAIARRQIADLESKGKLGPVASRWNNFWARKGLDGDQQAFRNTLDLLGSRLMAAHLQRTNVSALEHFGRMIPEDSTPDALKTELNEEYKYVLGQGKILGGPAAQ